MKFFCLLPEDACIKGVYLYVSFFGCSLFWVPCHAPCRILVPQPGIESMSLLWKLRKCQLLDHQEVPNVYVLMLTYLLRVPAHLPSLAMIPFSDGSSGSGHPFLKTPPRTHSPQLIYLDSQKETAQQDFYLMFYQFFLLPPPPHWESLGSLSQLH